MSPASDSEPRDVRPLWPSRFRFDRSGTRFLVYVQPPSTPGFEKPLPVYVKAAPGTIGPGPSDDRIRVVEATMRGPRAARDRRAKASYGYKIPYKYETKGLSLTTPPWTGDVREPVRPNPAGHFDDVDVGDPRFPATAAFATVRCVLDIWEHVFGRRLPWAFLATYRQLELIPRIESENGWSGDGFIELGFERKRTHERPLALNFDVVAHETGHLILKSVMGSPPEDRRTLAYRAFEEGSADLVSVVSLMHVDEAVEAALLQGRGRVMSDNLLSRLGDRRSPLNSRLLYHRYVMDSWALRQAWKEYDKHTYGRPFAGALYDLLAAMYHDRLRAADILATGTHVDGDVRARLAETDARLPRLFSMPAFAEAFAQARDRFARLLALTWTMTSAEGFSFGRALANLLAADQVLTGGSYRDTIRALFAWRGIVAHRS